mgnify:CR=1 FL=1
MIQSPEDIVICSGALSADEPLPPSGRKWPCRFPSYAASYLLKAGVTCEELGDNAKALTFYKKIKDQYANSPEGYDIDKYITRIENQTK